MVVFGQKLLYSGKVVVFGQSCCIQEKVVYSGKVVLFRKNCLYSGKSGSIQAKVDVFGQ